MQRQIVGTDKLADMGSIQGALEGAIQKLRSKNQALLTTSSRTDRGVHAFCNTGHVDLEHLKDGVDYDPDSVTCLLNQHLTREGHAISVIKTVPIASGFHARHHARCRYYLYRLAVLQDPALPDSIIPQKELRCRLPVVELHRSHIVGRLFNEEKLLEVASLLDGTHDFATFMCKKRVAPNEQAIQTLRALQIAVRPGLGLVPEHDPLYSCLRFYDITFTSRSFLYKQVRKIVGTMLSCAQGRTTLDEVRWLLDNPNVDNWPSYISLAPAHGLYLKRVEYDEDDFMNPP